MEAAAGKTVQLTQCAEKKATRRVAFIQEIANAMVATRLKPVGQTGHLARALVQYRLKFL
jgi:hypothetical protein